LALRDMRERGFTSALAVLSIEKDSKEGMCSRSTPPHLPFACAYR
jgi:hypothetical protein